jgi:hypothetical protein
MKVLIACFACLAAASFSGCAQVGAQRDYQDSVAKYKACLSENVASPQNCEGLRLAMETDEHKLSVYRGAFSPERRETVTILNR